MRRVYAFRYSLYEHFSPITIQEIRKTFEGHRMCCIVRDQTFRITNSEKHELFIFMQYDGEFVDFFVQRL